MRSGIVLITIVIVWANDTHIPGSSYDYVSREIAGLALEYDLVDRNLKVSIQKRFGATNVHERPYFVSFSSFYVKMKQKNRERFLQIYNAIRKYEVTKRISEIQTLNPNGLSEVDDFFVPGYIN